MCMIIAFVFLQKPMNGVAANTKVDLYKNQILHASLMKDSPQMV